MPLQLGTVSLPAVGPPAAPVTPLPESANPPEAASRQPVVAPAPAQSPAPSQQLNVADMEQIARRVGEALKTSSANLEFKVDDDSGKVVVRVVDSQTNELIRQIPSEEMLSISRALDQMQGLLLRQKA